MQDGDTEMMVGGRLTETAVEPSFDESWSDVAVIVAFPAPFGVKTPA
jgi:hypothetical protein